LRRSVLGFTPLLEVLLFTGGKYKEEEEEGFMLLIIYTTDFQVKRLNNLTLHLTV
jgi:hypothetical protein